MGDEDWKKWFENMAGYAPKVDNLNFPPHEDRGFCTTFWDEMFEAFYARAKSRLLSESTMTPEERAEWREKMVVKK